MTRTPRPARPGSGRRASSPADSELPYRVDFENDPTATAPAQRVVVTDPLDANIDWSTLQFTEVGFGDNMITIPAGSQHFQTTLSMTYNGLTFNVVIELALNTTTGVITATFQSIDPTTDLPPDVLIGFLPPEDGTGRGLGYFSYTVMPKAGLPTGTQIRDVATVTFDDNPPITTDQVNENDPSQGVDPAKQDLNTIDAVAPTSSVAALPAFSPASFTVSWSGHDDPGGSGIDSFDVYVSDDGGPFTLWQHDTTATSATFTGVDGHTYGFYSVAFDNAGNAQPTPSAAQATTTSIRRRRPAVHALPAFEPAAFTLAGPAPTTPAAPGIATSRSSSPITAPLYRSPSLRIDATSATFTGRSATLRLLQRRHRQRRQRPGHSCSRPRPRPAWTPLARTSSVAASARVLHPGYLYPQLVGQRHRRLRHRQLQRLCFRQRRLTFHAVPEQYHADLGHLHRPGRPLLRLLQRGDRQRRQRRPRRMPPRRRPL